MSRKSPRNNGADYAQFDNPYTGLVAMIFLQAQTDLCYLNGEETLYQNGNFLNKWEIINFLRSDWGWFLANSVGVEAKDYERYVRLATG